MLGYWDKSHVQAVIMSHLIVRSLKSSECDNTYVDGLVQERRNSSVLAMELHLSCINPSMLDTLHWIECLSTLILHNYQSKQNMSYSFWLSVFVCDAMISSLNALTGQI